MTPKDWSDNSIRSIKSHTMILVSDADFVRSEQAVAMFRLLPPGQLAILPCEHGKCIGQVTAAKRTSSEIQFSVASTTESRMPELVAAMIVHAIRGHSTFLVALACISVEARIRG